MAEVASATLDYGSQPDTRPGSAHTSAAAPAKKHNASSIISVREAELLTMIANLKSALEKATTNVTPTTKFMQVVGHRCVGNRQSAHKSWAP